MSITKLALRRPVSVLLLILTITVFGVGSLFGFRLAFFPQMAPPMLIAITMYNGASPDIVDELLSDPIEDLGKTVEGFDGSSATSEEGTSLVIYNFLYGTDIDQAYLDIQTEMDMLNLPEDAMDPMLLKLDVNSLPMMNLSLVGEEGMDVLLFANETLKPRLEALPGVAEVEISGGEEDYVGITVDETAMQQYGITINTISSAIQTSDYSIPIGEIDQGDQSLQISVSSAPEGLYELASIPVFTSGGGVLTLGEVATVTMRSAPAGSMSRNNGYDDIGVAITNAQDASIPTVAADIYDIIAELETSFPDVTIDITADSSEDIFASLESVAFTLLLAVGLCMVVLYIFFGNFKASLIVGSSIPISLLLAIMTMAMLDFELNIVTSTALVIAIGMMVDNSIVVLESVFRTKQSGGSFYDAAIKGSKAVGASVIASTITTIVVYLPLTFMGGLSGSMFMPLGFTIVFSMVASLISAVVLVPLFYHFIKPVEGQRSLLGRPMKALEKAYTRIVPKLLNKKKTVVFIAILTLIGAFMLLGVIEIEIMPASDMGTMQIDATFRADTRVEVANERILPIEEMVQLDERIAEYTVTVTGDSASVVAKLKDGYETDAIVAEYESLLLGASDMNIEVSAQSATGVLATPTNVISISGSNYDDVEAAARDMESRMYELDGVISISSPLSGNATQAEIDIDPLIAAHYGMSAPSIASTVRTANVGSDVGTMNIDGDEYDITIEYKEGLYDDFNAIMQMELPTQSGTSVPLSEVATLSLTDRAMSIEKSDGVYYIDLAATMDPAITEVVTAELDALRTSVTYDGDITIGDGVGNMNMMGELSTLVLAVFTAIFLVFVVMAMQFESVRFSLMVMMSVVFSFIGSFALLFITGSAISMPSLMGLLMLIGIVVNNGILYVDTASQLRETMPLEKALVESGRLRMRPIFMTTLTTALSMMPLALALGEGTEPMQGMAVIIIGGLVTSTILILILLPTFFLIIDKKDKSAKKMKRENKKKMRAIKKSNKQAVSEAKKMDKRDEKSSSKMNS